MKVKAYVELARPFTLLAPSVGFLSGGVVAWMARRPEGLSGAAATLEVLLGALAAACLNAASNAINQIYDLEIDRINKPKRPLPSGALSLGEAWVFTVVAYVFTFALAALVNLDFLGIVAVTTFITYAYSGPPFRTKRFGILANVTIAIPRGCLLVVAGWSAVASPADLEPWLLGTVMGLYILGAATTKDFSDMEGDQKYGCITLPIRYGIRASAWMIAPFFVLPFLVLAALAGMGCLSGNPLFLIGLGLALSAWGAFIAYLILRRPEDLAVEANHVSWKHMYLLMLVAQMGMAIAYLL
ncbi:MAG: UbiA family prenyltransferase [Candidatus Omnitrophica bacterium]|nr:UbiA family prenyltransferase [Candidatus Omnitrophota bacterium]